MRRCLLMILLVCAVLVSEADAQDRDPAFVPAHGWILVKEKVETVQADIAAYLARWPAGSRPDTFRIELHPQPDGQVALLFPEGVPAPQLTRLAAWIGSPCRKRVPPVAAAWVVAPDGVAYYLESEPALDTVEEGQDPRDDCDAEGGLLTGASRAGQSVRYDVLRTRLVKSDAGRPYREAPALRRSDAPTTVRVPLDVTIERRDALVLDTRSEPELVDVAIGYCRVLNGPDAAIESVWFWHQAHRADVSRKLWHEAGRTAIAARLTTATTDGDKACLSRLEREAKIRRIIRE
ncbi:hypothetical protein [Pseudoxanthomonas sp. PXM01]|uniref:hypothetical protein n=1 Tax=Pseudoxanthomonas sp. PXM01 TaxID=2769295 RepID=UPI0017858D98|nr:hypothetical protein [Pseudoxanthomonas sp. PXM01]MBD9467477.1 hypothetical protein [Pseudoxanthomonas sp. PXM01]